MGGLWVKVVPTTDATRTGIDGLSSTRIMDDVEIGVEVNHEGYAVFREDEFDHWNFFLFSGFSPHFPSLYLFLEVRPQDLCFEIIFTMGSKGRLWCGIELEWVGAVFKAKEMCVVDRNVVFINPS